MKHGFGLIEVIAASLVLAFLLIGLNTLQKGNRESILRIRARDAANVVAQDIIDSISAMGSASVSIGERKCPDVYDEEHDLCRTRIFTGSTSRKPNSSINVPMQYQVMVNVRPTNTNLVVNDSTEFMKALGNNNNFNVKHQIAKQVDITVNWKFKNSDQSINVSSVIR